MLPFLKAYNLINQLELKINNHNFFGGIILDIEQVFCYNISPGAIFHKCTLHHKIIIFFNPKLL